MLLKGMMAFFLCTGIGGKLVGFFLCTSIGSNLVGFFYVPVFAVI